MTASLEALAWGSHLPVLLEVIKRTKKPVLELGAGNYSTRQIHDGCKNKITTIESSKEWARRYQSLVDKRHDLLVLSEKEMIEEFFAKDDTPWGLVFVDCETWEGRVAAIKKYKNVADYVIIHDTEVSAQMGVFGRIMAKEKRDFSDDFTQWIEYRPTHHALALPATVLASNKINLKDIIIEKIEITNFQL